MTQRGEKRERVIRVLLNEPSGKLSKYRVSKLAQCSFSWVHEFSKELEQKGFIEKTTVRDYSGLVKFWLKIKTRPRAFGFMHRDPNALIKNTLLPYALTTYSAENLVQHFLFPSRVDLYIKKDDMQRWQKMIMTDGLMGQGNLRLIVADEHVFYKYNEIQGFNVVSIPQLIVDLLFEGGVCTEAGEKLLEKAASNV
jgi:hypothetical protein